MQQNMEVGQTVNIDGEIYVLAQGDGYSSVCMDCALNETPHCTNAPAYHCTDVPAGFWVKAGTEEDFVPEVAEIMEPSSGTPIQRVAAMNTAFGNPKGDYKSVDIPRIVSQVKNILDEYNEFLEGAAEGNLIKMRDALCDIQVFAAGGQHLMGVDGDADMHAVIDGVMTRFIKDDADKEATIANHAAKGVHLVYFEGEYPTMVMKSAIDQPDAPKGKFLKSASYQDTVFPGVK